MLLLLLHGGVTFALAGLLWHVQLVRYPRFLQVTPDEFPRHPLNHCVRISAQILPMVMLEAATAGWLLYAGERHPLFLAAVAIMAVNWLSTALIQAPIHLRLMSRYNPDWLRLLLASNWVRTVGWTARAALIAAVVVDSGR